MIFQFLGTLIGIAAGIGIYWFIALRENRWLRDALSKNFGASARKEVNDD